jgi:hypothetical protein
VDIQRIARRKLGDVRFQLSCFYQFNLAHCCTPFVN